MKKWEKMYFSGKKCSTFVAVKPQKGTDMGYIVGHFTCKLDSKGRLMLPSEFKEQMGAQADEGFVLRPGLFDNCKCLDLYTRRDWDELQDKMRNSLNLFDEDDLATIRFFNSGARFAKLDANGRLQIPKDLMDKGLLAKEVVIESVANKMEIWDKERYEASIGAVDNKKVLQILRNIK